MDQFTLTVHGGDTGLEQLRTVRDLYAEPPYREGPAMSRTSLGPGRPVYDAMIKSLVAAQEAARSLAWDVGESGVGVGANQVRRPSSPATQRRPRKNSCSRCGSTLSTTERR